MHYAICNDFSVNQLGFSKNLCIMRIMHYDGMHYEKVYCIKGGKERLMDEEAKQICPSLYMPFSATYVHSCFPII